jgi:hypothetical protein
VKVWLAVPPFVVRDVKPKLLTNVNVPSPPTVFFTTVICPINGGATMALVMVHVVVAPATTTMPPGVPLVQTALI